MSQSAPLNDDQNQPNDYLHGDHCHTASNPQPVSIEDDDDEDQQHQCCPDDVPNVAIFGRVEDTDAFSEVNAGKGESLEIINNVEEKLLDDNAMQEKTESTAVQEVTENTTVREATESTLVQEVTESTAIQEESQAGASKSQEWVLSQSGRPAVTNIVTGTYVYM